MIRYNIKTMELQIDIIFQFYFQSKTQFYLLTEYTFNKLVNIDQQTYNTKGGCFAGTLLK